MLLHVLVWPHCAAHDVYLYDVCELFAKHTNMSKLVTVVGLQAPHKMRATCVRVLPHCWQHSVQLKQLRPQMPQGMQALLLLAQRQPCAQTALNPHLAMAITQSTPMGISLLTKANT